MTPRLPPRATPGERAGMDSDEISCTGLGGFFVLLAGHCTAFEGAMDIWPWTRAAIRVLQVLDAWKERTTYEVDSHKLVEHGYE